MNNVDRLKMLLSDGNAELHDLLQNVRFYRMREFDHRKLKPDQSAKFDRTLLIGQDNTLAVFSDNSMLSVSKDEICSVTVIDHNRYPVEDMLEFYQEIKD